MRKRISGSRMVRCVKEIRSVQRMPRPKLTNRASIQDNCDRDHAIKKGKNSQKTARVKSAKYGAGAQTGVAFLSTPVIQENSRDEKSAQHEEKLNASSPQSGQGKFCHQPMRNSDAKKRQRPQAIELRHVRGRIWGS